MKASDTPNPPKHKVTILLDHDIYQAIEQIGKIEFDAHAPFYALAKHIIKKWLQEHEKLTPHHSTSKLYTTNEYGDYPLETLNERCENKSKK